MKNKFLYALLFTSALTAQHIFAGDENSVLNERPESPVQLTLVTASELQNTLVRTESTESLTDLQHRPSSPILENFAEGFVPNAGMLTQQEVDENYIPASEVQSDYVSKTEHKRALKKAVKEAKEGALATIQALNEQITKLTADRDTYRNAKHDAIRQYNDLVKSLQSNPKASPLTVAKSDEKTGTANVKPAKIEAKNEAKKQSNINTLEVDTDEDEDNESGLVAQKSKEDCIREMVAGKGTRASIQAARAELEGLDEKEKI